MIQASEFVEAARQQGFSLYAGVPCSYLTPFINYVIADDKLTYISSANEGDAVATAAGAVLGGQRAIAMMQNSGLGNAVSPLTSLNHVFRLPILLVITWRGDPEIPDEPQHQLMGQITAELLDCMRIPWEYFPDQPAQIAEVLDRATAYMDRQQRPYALIMRKGTVAKHPLAAPAASRRQFPGYAQDKPPAGPLPSRRQALQAIVAQTPTENTVVIATTGFTGRELFALADRPNHLYMVGSMGCASSLALGLALARPDLTVVVIDGDGAALMRMGNLATIGCYGRNNLLHILLDNGVHDSTGGQATVSSQLDFAAIASACGYARVEQADSADAIPAWFRKEAAGPAFLHLYTQPGAPADLPRPAMTPEQVKQRLMHQLLPTQHPELSKEPG